MGDSDEELREVVRRLEEADVTIVGASDHTVTHSLYILDPDGNEIELYIDVPGSRLEGGPEPDHGADQAAGPLRIARRHPRLLPPTRSCRLDDPGRRSGATDRPPGPWWARGWMVGWSRIFWRKCMFDGRWRGKIDRGTGPVGQKLQQWGVTADLLTATGLISATATAVAVATGHLHLAILLLILTGMHDLLDGPVAKASGTSSVQGGLFRLGHRPGRRCPDSRGGGLVPRFHPSGPSRASALRRARRHLLGLLPAGQGGVAGHRRPGWTHGTSREDDPARASDSCRRCSWFPCSG